MLLIQILLDIPKHYYLQIIFIFKSLKESIKINDYKFYLNFNVNNTCSYCSHNNETALKLFWMYSVLNLNYYYYKLTLKEVTKSIITHFTTSISFFKLFTLHIFQFFLQTFLKSSYDANISFAWNLFSDFAIC